MSPCGMQSCNNILQSTHWSNQPTFWAKNLLWLHYFTLGTLNWLVQLNMFKECLGNIMFKFSSTKKEVVAIVCDQRLSLAQMQKKIFIFSMKMLFNSKINFWFDSMRLLFERKFLTCFYQGAETSCMCVCTERVCY